MSGYPLPAARPPLTGNAGVGGSIDPYIAYRQLLIGRQIRPHHRQRQHLGRGSGIENEGNYSSATPPSALYDKLVLKCAHIVPTRRRASYSYDREPATTGRVNTPGLSLAVLTVTGWMTGALR